MTHPLAHYEARKLYLTGQIAAERERHARTMKDLRDELELAEVAARQIAAKLDSGKILLAEHVIAVDGLFDRAGDDRQQIREDAIQDLLAGGQKLRESYLGTKTYAHWHGQGVCFAYGTVPRHGSVIFRISMLKPRRENPAPLSAEEVEATVYYLRALESIQAAQIAAVAAAERA